MMGHISCYSLVLATVVPRELVCPTHYHNCDIGVSVDGALLPCPRAGRRQTADLRYSMTGLCHPQAVLYAGQ